MTAPSKKALVIAALVVAMVALHQDAWNWKDATLVFGFLPVGLAYHVGYSLLSALFMAALVRYAWPADLDEAAPEAAPASATVDGARR